MAEAPLSPEEIAHRSFPTSFRGFDTGEVRAYLARVADELRAAAANERDFQKRLGEAEHRALHPILDQATLSRAVGEEMARLLASAQEAAQELRAKAEENAGRILREAHEHAQRVRDDAERVLARRTAEADEAAAAVRAAAEVERVGLLERAQRDVDDNLSEVETRARKLVEDAEADRTRVLTDLGRRRRMVNSQVQQLRAGRERLLDAYRVVRRTLDEVSEELERVEVEARSASTEAARRLAGRAEGAAPSGSAVGIDGEEVEAAEAPAAAETAADAATAPHGSVDGAAPDRSASMLRLVRSVEPPPRVVTRLDVVHPPAEIEAVRVIGGDAPAAPSPAPDTAAERPPESAVDGLFARMRAERARAVARADDVLGVAPPAEAADVEEPQVDVPVDDEARREARDAAVEAIQEQLVRRLKRALQDDQNEALDRLRAGRSGPRVADLVPADEQAARLRGAALELLGEAYLAGARLAVADAHPSPEAAPMAADLATAIMAPLRRALETGLAGGDDDAGVVDRIGAAYRECRAQRVDGAVSDAVVAAFAHGTLATATGPLRWVVDDDGTPCADCDDNELTGPTPPGEAYPTGQTAPPAHAGCRCLLAPAHLASPG